MFRRRKQEDRNEKVFLDMVDRIRGALKDFLFTEEDRAKFKSLQDKITTIEADINKMSNDISALEACIKSLSDEQHKLKDILSVVARSIQDRINQ